MSDPSWQEELGPVLLTMQIIVGALVAGCLTFFVVVCAVSLRGDAADESLVITYTAIVFACVALVVRTIVPGLIVAQGRRRIIEGTWQGSPTVNARFSEQTGDAGKLAAVFTTRLIVAAALLEGTAFFAMIAYMLEGSPLALILAAALILGVALHFPTRARLVDWIEEQLTLIEQERCS